MAHARGIGGWPGKGIPLTASFPQLPAARAVENGRGDEANDAPSHRDALALVQQQQREIEQLQGVVARLQEELSLKQEQFEFLYSSLRASTEKAHHTQKNHELALIEKLQKLEHLVQQKDLLQTQTEQQLREARAELLLLRCANARTVNELPYEVLYNTFKYLPASDLCVVSSVNRYWHAVASVNALWRAVFLQQFGVRRLQSRSHGAQANADDRDDDMRQNSPVRWKEVFKDHFVLEENWTRGRGRISTLLGHQGTVTCLSLRGARMISGSDDGSMILWDLCPPQTDPPAVPAVALAGLIDVGSSWRGRSATSEQIYGAGAGGEMGSRSSRFQQRNYARIFSFHGHGGPIWSLDYRPEDDLLVSGSYDETIKVWRVSTGKCLRSLRGHDGWVSSLSMISADRVVSGSWDATVRLWDVADGELLATMQAGAGNALYCLSVSADKQSVAVGSRHCQVQLFDLEQAAQVRSLVGHSKEVYSVHCAETHIVSGSGDSSIKMWDTRAFECATTLSGHTATVMCLRYDGEHRIVSGSYDRTVKTWDVRSTRAPVTTFACHDGPLFCLELDETRLVTGSADHSIKLFDFSSPRY